MSIFFNGEKCNFETKTLPRFLSLILDKMLQNKEGAGCCSFLKDKFKL